MADYKFERLRNGIAYKTVFEDLAVFRALIKTLIEEEMLEQDPVKKWQEIFFGGNETVFQGFKVPFMIVRLSAMPFAPS